MHPQIFSLLEDLYAKTCVVATSKAAEEGDSRSANEKAFADMFGEQLKKAFEHARLHRGEPEKAWQPFKEILVALASRESRRGGHSVQVRLLLLSEFEQIAEMSSWLSRLSRSSVPVPGQEAAEWNEVVMLQRVGRTAVVLPTKTRPKKITLGGSDGKE